jgi:hypothetical protein
MYSLREKRLTLQVQNPETYRSDLVTKKSELFHIFLHFFVIILGEKFSVHYECVVLSYIHKGIKLILPPLLPPPPGTRFTGVPLPPYLPPLPPPPHRQIQAVPRETRQLNQLTFSTPPSHLTSFLRFSLSVLLLFLSDILLSQFLLLTSPPFSDFLSLSCSFSFQPSYFLHSSFSPHLLS